MATVASSPAPRRRPFRVRYLWWAAFGAMTVLVLLTRERTLLNPNSFLRHRYAPIAALMFAHGIPGAIALVLGPFQFSTRLRQRFTKLHRVSGRIYAGCALVSAPMAIAIAIALPIPTLLAASSIQAIGWTVTTATAIYCILTGRVQQHREWMMRSYPFAAVFIVVRAVRLIPAIQRMGLVGTETVVWTTVALAGIVPSFLIAWQAMPARKRVVTRRAVQAAD